MKRTTLDSLLCAVLVVVACVAVDAMLGIGIAIGWQARALAVRERAELERVNKE